MKKSLLALALLGAFGAASAQSSVTLYGIADVNLQRSDPKSGTASDVQATTGVSSGYQAGSRLGVRGTESLGGGLSAIFALELGYNIDTGTRAQQQAATTINNVFPNTGTSTIPAVDRLFGRQAWAGLSGGFGSLVMGRIPTFSSGTGSFDMFGNIDPFDTGWGALGLQNSMSSANSLRLDNTVAYVTPTMGGFKAGAAYSFNAIGAEAAGSNSNVKVMGLGASFGAGPFYGAVTYDSVDWPSTVSNDDQTHLQIGGTFDLKFVKLHGAYAMEEALVAFDSGKSASGGDADAWMVGATIPVGGATQIRASYQLRSADSFRGSAEGEKSVWGIGLRHSLSSRTHLAIGYGDITLKDGLKTATNGGLKELTAGIRHNF